jgi:hypothetical protein
VIGRLLCRLGLHAWRNKTPRSCHAHVICVREHCLRREVWLDANPLNGYQPYDRSWPSR